MTAGLHVSPDRTPAPVDPHTPAVDLACTELIAELETPHLRIPTGSTEGGSHRPGHPGFVPGSRKKRLMTKC